MKLSELKQHLLTAAQLNFILPNGKPVPKHFHVTEVGQITKHFIDCGGTIRKEQVVSLQLWEAGDDDHLLAPQKLVSIINLSEKSLGIIDAEIEVEYQSDTIGKYGLEYDGSSFLLTSKKTDCLASDNCGTSSEKQKSSSGACCTPGGGCC
ncbi:MAG: DUF6428 family protein [Flavobacteriales bacterium]